MILEKELKMFGWFEEIIDTVIEAPRKIVEKVVEEVEEIADKIGM